MWILLVPRILHWQALINKKLKLKGGPMKCFSKNLLDHETFNSMVPWAKIFIFFSKNCKILRPPSLHTCNNSIITSDPKGFTLAIYVWNFDSSALKKFLQDIRMISFYKLRASTQFVFLWNYNMIVHSFMVFLRSHRFLCLNYSCFLK